MFNQKGLIAKKLIGWIPVPVSIGTGTQPRLTLLKCCTNVDRNQKRNKQEQKEKYVAGFCRQCAQICSFMWISVHSGHGFLNPVPPHIVYILHKLRERRNNSRIPPTQHTNMLSQRIDIHYNEKIEKVSTLFYVTLMFKIIFFFPFLFSAYYKLRAVLIYW